MTSNNFLLVVLAGAGGGVLRGIMGIAKSVVLKKNFEMNWKWFSLSVFVSALVGIIAATFFGDDLRLALLAGYTGADFIEGLMKMKMKERFKDSKGGFGDLFN